MAKKEYDEAIASYLKCLTIDQKALGPDHLDVATTHHVIGSIHAAKGNKEAAIDSLNKAKKIRVRRLGPRHPETQATVKDIEKLSSPPDDGF